MIPEWLQSGITLAIVGIAVASLVRHFVRPRRGCDRCKPAAKPRDGRRRGLPIVS